MVRATGHEDTCLVCHKKVVTSHKGVKDCYECYKCPRVYHHDCLSGDITFGLGGQWNCVQHRCTVCQLVLMACGGLLYTCVSCPTALCDDCMPDQGVEEVGFNYPPMEPFNYVDTKHVYYIKCVNCLIPGSKRKVTISMRCGE